MAEGIPQNRRESSAGRKGGVSVLPVIIYAVMEALILAFLILLELRGEKPVLQTALMYGSIVLNTAAALVFLMIRLFSGRKTVRVKAVEALTEAAEQAQKVRIRAVFRILFHGLALLFTLAADTVLVLLDRWYFWGVLLFCIVQTFYALVLRGKTGVLIVRIGCFLLVTAALFLLHMAEPLTVASAYSITQLTINMALAWVRVFRRKRTADSDRIGQKGAGTLLAALGLSLFFLCDVSVGIFNLNYSIHGYTMLTRVSGFLMWVFYLPSQVLLVLSFWRRIWDRKIGRTT